MKSYALIVLACLACEASARSVRQLRTAAAPKESNSLQPDSGKETLLIEHNADALLRFLDASALARNGSSSEAASASENSSAAAAPAPAPAAAEPAPPAAAPQQPYEQFRVDCLAHVHQLVDNIDRSYTDVQMENVLKHECAMESEFPAAKEDGFHTEAACHEFAELLTKARHEELATGSQEGYEEFCQKYYEHRNAHPIGTPTAKPLYVSEVRVEKPEPTTTTTTETTTTAAPKEEESISSKLWLLLLVTVVLVFAGIAFLRR